MKHIQQLTAILEREGNGYVALCPELDIASQGHNVEEARLNLIEACELFFECASPSEIEPRLHNNDNYSSALERGINCLRKDWRCR
jgi:predicted RNase H-like HicB family nuclease